MIDIVRQVNHEEMADLIKAFYGKRIGLFVWGSMGIGKSRVFKDVAMELAKEKKLLFSDKLTDLNSDKHFCFVDIRASQLDPTDIKGLPRTNEEYTEWMVSNFLPKKGSGIILFDETNLAPPLVQASLYELLYDKKLVANGYILPEGYSIFCAGNRTEDRANTFEMAAPLLNRLAHVELRIPSVEEWTEWAIKHEVDSRLIGFLQQRVSLLHRFDPKMKDKAYPTPRSIEFGSIMIKDIDSKRLDDLDLFMSTLVGEGFAKEFVGFIKLQRNIDIDEIMKNPELVKKIDDLDLKYNLVSLLAEKYKKDNKKLNVLLTVCSYMQPEFAILLLRFMKQYSGEGYLRANLTKCDAWKIVGSRYREILVE